MNQKRESEQVRGEMEKFFTAFPSLVTPSEFWRVCKACLDFIKAFCPSMGCSGLLFAQRQVYSTANVQKFVNGHKFYQGD